MAIRLIIDNNIPDAFEALSEPQRTAVTDALRSDRFEFYATLELLEETMCLGATSRRDLLRPRVRWLLRVMQNRVLSHVNQISVSELRGAPEIYLKGDQREWFQASLEEIANSDGPLPPDLVELAQRSRGYKDDNNKFFKDHQALFRGLAREELPDRPMSYATFVADWRLPRKRRELEDLFRCVQHPDPAAKAGDALAHPDWYPHVDLLIDIEGARLYRTVVLNRKVAHGDAHDTTQLVYLHDVDWFVSNETKPTGLIRETYDFVFGQRPEKRLLTFEEFVAEL